MGRWEGLLCSEASTGFNNPCQLLEPAVCQALSPEPHHAHFILLLLILFSASLSLFLNFL